MAGPGEDIVSKYFKKGSLIEISCNDDGFRGSFYAGTVIRPPKKNSKKVLVEYATLTEDKAGKQPLREVLDVVHLRPPPPRENHHAFKVNEEVDAYCNDGWWEGVITEVVEDRYTVFFRGTREQLNFKAPKLRLHREWVYGKWVPPLEEAPSVMPSDEKSIFSAKVEADKDVIEHNFSPGDFVEVCSDEEGFEDAWFTATVLKSISKDKYLVEYQNLKNDDDTGFLREEVDGKHMRPCPPDVGLLDRFELHDEVDALHNDCWWVGVISKVLKSDRYSVYFKNSDEELKFVHSKLRVHQEWRNGKWHIASKVLD